MVNSKQRNQFFVLGFHAAGSAFAASREPFVAVFPIHTPTRRASILIALVDPRLGTSIHAPVKGATSQLGKALTGQDHFNPRSRERSDMRFGIADHNRDNFNPRSRERSDSHSSKPTTVWTYFNPRSREGSDPLDRRDDDALDISIHAPVKGATTYTYLNGAWTQVSIHAPVKGATRPYSL